MLPLNRGLSRALKTVRRTVFAPRYADAGPGLFSSPMVHLKAAASRKKANKKTPCNLMQGVCGAPSGTRTQDPLIKRYSVLVPYVFPFLHFVDFTLFLCTFLVFTFPLLPFISFNFPHLLEHNLSKNP